MALPLPFHLHIAVIRHSRHHVVIAFIHLNRYDGELLVRGQLSILLDIRDGL